MSIFKKNIINFFFVLRNVYMRLVIDHSLELKRNEKKKFIY